MSNLLFCAGFILSAVVVVQLIIWLNNRFLAPWLQRGLPKRQPFIYLIEAGFRLQPSQASWHETDEPGIVIGLVGEVDDYTVEVSTDYNSGLWKSQFYLMRIFFNTDNLTIQELENRLRNNIESSQYIRWNDDIKLTFTHVEDKWLISSAGPPHGKRVLDNIKHLITELQKLGLKPISYEEAKIQWQKTS